MAKTKFSTQGGVAARASLSELATLMCAAKLLRLDAAPQGASVGPRIVGAGCEYRAGAPAPMFCVDKGDGSAWASVSLAHVLGSLATPASQPFLAVARAAMESLDALGPKGWAEAISASGARFSFPAPRWGATQVGVGWAEARAWLESGECRSDGLPALLDSSPASGQDPEARAWVESLAIAQAARVAGSVGLGPGRL